jgi:hypothetical protein
VLKHSVTQLTTSRTTWRNRALAAESARSTLVLQVGTLQSHITQGDSTVAALQNSNNTLNAERVQMLSGLSGEMATYVSHATGASDIYNTILGPALHAWTCGGDVFLGQTFISVDFNRLGYC